MPAGWAGRLAGCRGLFLQLLLETFAESVSHPIGFHRHSFWFSAMRRRNKRPFGFGNTDFPDFGVSRSQVITGRYSDAQTAGYKKVEMYVTVTCSHFAFNEEGGLDENVAYNSGIYDLYTGRALPSRSTTGDAAYDYSATVEVDGTSYDISYSKNVQWMVLPLDGGEVYRRCNQNWVFEVPEAYDGLVYCAADKLSYDPSTYSEEIDENEYYAMDLLNDESCAADTTVFFRFGDKTQ